MLHHNYSEITLSVEVRYGDFEITLQKWIDQKLYEEPGLVVRAVSDASGQPLPLNTLPEKYLPNVKLNRDGIPENRPVTLLQKLKATVLNIFS
ncbi:MAG: hypothetical protein AAGK74_22085 [Chloroflexota bacterium]